MIDHICDYVSEHLKHKRGSSVECDEIHQSYLKYCSEKDITPENRSVLGKHIMNLLPCPEKKRLRIGVRRYVYLNIALT